MFSGDIMARGVLLVVLVLYASAIEAHKGFDLMDSLTLRALMRQHHQEPKDGKTHMFSARMNCVIRMYKGTQKRRTTRTSNYHGYLERLTQLWAAVNISRFSISKLVFEIPALIWGENWETASIPFTLNSKFGKKSWIFVICLHLWSLPLWFHEKQQHYCWQDLDL